MSYHLSKGLDENILSGCHGINDAGKKTLCKASYILDVSITCVCVSIYASVCDTLRNLNTLLIDLRHIHWIITPPQLDP